MTTSTSLEELLTAVSKVLMWCAVLGFALLLFWFCVILALGDLAFQVQETMFDLSKHEFDMLNYYGIAAFKMCVFLLFVIPWGATQLVLRGMRTTRIS